MPRPDTNPTHESATGGRGQGSAAPSPRPRCRLFVIALISLALTAACSTPKPIHDVSPDKLRAEIARDVPSLSKHSVVVPHEISEETFAFIHSRVDDLDDPSRGARALLKLLFDEEYLGLEYAWGETQTGDLTVRSGRGNCLSLAAVLVGTARRYSGAARYVEVLDRAERREEGDLQIWASHIAVLLPSLDGPLIVDFRGTVSEDGSIRFKRLGDRDLIAHYYNDKGYESIRRARDDGRAAPWQEAASLFTIATQIDPHLSRAWNNLGVALARLGDLSGADAAYRHALRTRGQFLERATAKNLISLELRRLDSAPTPSRATKGSQQNE